MSLPAKQPSGDLAIEGVIAHGDLSKLTPAQRNDYYVKVCKSIGLNPLTQPFQYITLNGKLQLYARKDCTDQLRKIHGISIEIVSQEVADDILTVHARARDKDGRQDEDVGAVAFPQTLRGDNRANAALKAVTKAKRRVTLSICGLGFLDETEVEDIPAVAKRQPPPDLIDPPHDPETGEILSEQTAGTVPAEPPAAPAHDQSPPAGAAGPVTSADVMDWQAKLNVAALRGMAELEVVWHAVPNVIQPLVRKHTLDLKHKLENTNAKQNTG